VIHVVGQRIELIRACGVPLRAETIGKLAIFGRRVLFAEKLAHAIEDLGLRGSARPGGSASTARSDEGPSEAGEKDRNEGERHIESPGERE
jgi:hypothetical protein